MRRGEIRWYTFAQPDKRRPVLLLTRDTVIDSINEIIVVPATRTIRGLIRSCSRPRTACPSAVR
jgi:mRNA interferase MazF